jgi:hypothetical protein
MVGGHGLRDRADNGQQPARLREGRPGSSPSGSRSSRRPDDQTASAVTDETGYYRVINLPPGDYTVTAGLQGLPLT